MLHKRLQIDNCAFGCQPSFRPSAAVVLDPATVPVTLCHIN